jgi:hypothetical protein
VQLYWWARCRLSGLYEGPVAQWATERCRVVSKGLVNLFLSCTWGCNLWQGGGSGVVSRWSVPSGDRFAEGRQMERELVRFEDRDGGTRGASSGLVISLVQEVSKLHDAP